MATVRLDGRLRESGAGPRWETDAPTVERLLDELEAEHPRLRRELRDEHGEVRRHVRIFVNGEDVRNGAGTGTPIASSDRIDILRSVPGG